MGSIGAHKGYLQNGDFENLDEFDEQTLNDNQEEARNTGEFANGWNFPGIRDSVARLGDALDRTQSQARIAAIHRQLVSLDNQITREYNSATPNDDKNALLTYRRQVRQLLNKIRNMGL